MSRKEIPVYLVTGFLESGKTGFIRSTLADKTFNSGERTLVLVCEEGIEEYEPSTFNGYTFLRTVENAEELCEEYFNKLYDELKFERILVEYNGMWLADVIYGALPENYIVYQEFMFADATTFINYNSNMRQLVYDKLKNAQLVVFNRFPDNGDVMPFHKLVRAVNRRCDIAYERKDGKTKFDDIEDPLPFDVNAPVITIEDRDYAIWYSDLCENIRTYKGKTVCFKAQVFLDGVPAGCAAVGRQMMNCCAADISFAGMIADNFDSNGIVSGEWYAVTGSIRVARHEAYKSPGPVMTVTRIVKAECPEEPVATFY